MDVSLHAVEGETRAQRRAAFQVSQRLGSRIGDIGSNILEGLIYLSESDNFLKGPMRPQSASIPRLDFVKMGGLPRLPGRSVCCQT
jgi:hypothetical protein